MVRTFKKPTLSKDKPLEVNTEKRTPFPTRFLKGIEPPSKQQTEREKYLARLDSQIFEKEKEWEAHRVSIETNTRAMDESFRKHNERLTTDLQTLESELAIKRQERAELNAPLDAQKHSLDEREKQIALKEKASQEKGQSLFEKDRLYEVKLDSVKDLSDQLSEARMSLSIREKRLEVKERTLSQHEMEYLAAVQNLKENEKNITVALQAREYAASLKELAVQSREENLIQREQKLLENNIRLTDQRGVLARAWKELEQKKHG